MATTPMDRPAGAQSQTAAQAAGPVLKALHSVWLAGLGLAVVAGEQTAHAINALVQKGKQVEPGVLERGKKAGETVSEAVGDVGSKLKTMASKPIEAMSGAEAATEGLDEKVASAIERLGLPTKQQFEQLMSKLSDLESRLEQHGHKTGKQEK